MTNNEVNKVVAEYMGFKYKQLAGLAYEGFWVDTNKHKSEDTNTLLGALHFNRDGFKLARELSYTDSLDALVPVWERLSVEFSYIDGHFNIHRDNHENSVICNEFVYKKSIQEAAAHATAKAILALNEKEKND